MVRAIKSLDELNEDLKKISQKLVVIDFFATWVILSIEIENRNQLNFSWCGPCVRIAPKIEEWSNGDYKESVVFMKVDVDEAEEVAAKYSVDAMPTFVLIKDGKEIDRVVGASVDQLKEKIEKNK